MEDSGTAFSGLFTLNGVGRVLHFTTNTMLRIALSHLLGRGVRLETHEAVALARELLAHPCGIPTPENIQLGSDGSASCANIEGTRSVVSVADLLLTLLPPGTPNVPAPLRFAIARGLEMVEAPPFASPAEFSSVLERFQKGASRDVLRGILQRAAGPSRSIAEPTAVAPAPEDACGGAFASGAAAHDRSATTGRCRAADVQVVRRPRRSGLHCGLVTAVGTGRRGVIRRVVCRRLRRRGRHHHPPCRDKAIRLRARVAPGLDRRPSSERFGCELSGSRTET
jgi:hypothetical protein